MPRRAHATSDLPRRDPRRARAASPRRRRARRGRARPPVARLPAARARPGRGKRAAARAVAAELLRRGAPDPDGARTRAQHGAHPDLTWVVPAARTRCCAATWTRRWSPPPRARRSRPPFRVFVLERADTMNDEAANALLKTLEEPPAYVVLLLLTDRPAQVLPTIASRCQPVRFDPAAAGRCWPRASKRAAWRPSRRPRRRGWASATGSARWPSRSATGPRCARRPRTSRAPPLHGRVGAERPWRRAARGSRAPRGAAARDAYEARLAEELQFLPRKEHRRRETELGEQARRAERRARDGGARPRPAAVGLWYRDLACVAAGAPELAHHADRPRSSPRTPRAARPAPLRAAVELVDDIRARLALNVALRPGARGARLPARAHAELPLSDLGLARPGATSPTTRAPRAPRRRRGGRSPPPRP